MKTTARTTTKKTTPAKKTASVASTKKASTKIQKSTPKKNEGHTPFENLFVNLLNDIYWAELALANALQKMHDAATTYDLKDAFEDHLYVTKKHVARLEKVFLLIGVDAEPKKCDAMAGIIKEGESIINETETGTMTRDAGLIVTAQKAEHYEIATYGSLVQIALTLGHDQAASLLARTLSEEKVTDQLLTDIAETEVNPLADEWENIYAGQWEDVD